MESWRKVWREGVAPLLSTVSLAALAKGFGDRRRPASQGATTTPPPLQCVHDWPVECRVCARLLRLAGRRAGIRGGGRGVLCPMCFEIDRCLGEPAGCRWFLNWFDETPRLEMRRLLLAEVNAPLLCSTPTSPARPLRLALRSRLRNEKQLTPRKGAQS